MWSELLSAASTVLGRGGGGSTATVSGAPNFVDASFDSSQWTVATGSSSARAENSRVDVPVAASAALAGQSAAPYVGDVGGMQSAGFGGLDLGGIWPVILLAAGLALVVKKG